MNRFKRFVTEMPWAENGYDFELEKPIWADKLIDALQKLSAESRGAFLEPFEYLQFAKLFQKRFGELPEEKQKKILELMPDGLLKHKLQPIVTKVEEKKMGSFTEYRKKMLGEDYKPLKGPQVLEFDKALDVAAEGVWRLRDRIRSVFYQAQTLHPWVTTTALSEKQDMMKALNRVELGLKDISDAFERAKEIPEGESVREGVESEEPNRCYKCGEIIPAGEEKWIPTESKCALEMGQVDTVPYCKDCVAKDPQLSRLAKERKLGEGFDDDSDDFGDATIEDLKCHRCGDRIREGEEEWIDLEDIDPDSGESGGAPFCPRCMQKDRELMKLAGFKEEK